MTNAVPSTPSIDQPAPSAQTTGRPQLRRSGTDKMLGGVSGGLAEYSGIDTLLWRVGFIGLTLAGGAGIPIYLLLWVLMPPAPQAADQPLSAVDRFIGRLHTGLADAGLTTPRT
jgi:phage shock protein PspC (stress-responsive transcriptional regulator)